MPEPGLSQKIAGAACALLIGLAKTGLPSAGTLAVPLAVYAVGDARRAAGWLLPLLCAGDVLAVASWWRYADFRKLLQLTPWVVGGMLLGGWALAGRETLVRRLVGVLVLVSIAWSVLDRARKSSGRTSGALTSAYGLAAGFATTVANAGGPILNAYLYSHALPTSGFIATQAWFFFFVNAMKVPIYLLHDLIDGGTLGFDAWLLPLTLLGGVAGRAVARRLPQRIFDSLVLALSTIAAVTLLL